MGYIGTRDNGKESGDYYGTLGLYLGFMSRQTNMQIQSWSPA